MKGSEKFILFNGVDGAKRAVQRDSIRVICDDVDKVNVVQVTLADGSWFTAEGTVDSIMQDRSL